MDTGCECGHTNAHPKDPTLGFPHALTTTMGCRVIPPQPGLPVATHHEFSFPREKIKEKEKASGGKSLGCLLGGVEPANFMHLLLVRVGSLLTCSWAQFPAPRASREESDSSLKTRSLSTVCSPAPTPGGDAPGAAARPGLGLPAVCTHLGPSLLPQHQPLRKFCRKTLPEGCPCALRDLSDQIVPIPKAAPCWAPSLPARGTAEDAPTNPHIPLWAGKCSRGTHTSKAAQSIPSHRQRAGSVVPLTPFRENPPVPTVQHRDGGDTASPWRDRQGTCSGSTGCWQGAAQAFGERSLAVIPAKHPSPAPLHPWLRIPGRSGGAGSAARGPRGAGSELARSSGPC